MSKGHTAVNAFLENKVRYADFFNGSLFQGRQVILAEELEVIKGESDILVEDKEGERDMCKALEDMCLHAEEKGIEEGREMGIRLTKKVYQLHQQGKSNIEIAKECGIELRTVEEILE